METLERIESARLARTLGEGFAYDRQAFAELGARCMLAGVPRQAVYWFTALSEGAAGHVLDPGPFIATHRLIGFSSSLVRASLWHPWISRIALPFQMRRLHRVIDRCSKFPTMQWLDSLKRTQDLMRLRGLWNWVKDVEHHEKQPRWY